jgi:hypothetical protein
LALALKGQAMPTSLHSKLGIVIPQLEHLSAGYILRIP